MQRWVVVVLLFVGDRGFLGVQDGLQVPMVGFWIAMLAAGALALAAFALLGWLVPTGWWQALTVVGAVALLVTVAGFLGWTKILPIVLSGVLLWIAFARPPVAP